MKKTTVVLSLFCLLFSCAFWSDALSAEGAIMNQTNPTIVRVTGNESPWVDVKEYGAKGDGISDDSVAISQALQSSAQLILLSPGSYKITSGIIVPDGKTLKGFGAKSVKVLNYSSGGTALTLKNGGKLSGFSVESRGVNQNGVFVAGVNPVMEDIELAEFQGVSLQLGRAGVVGSYFGRIENIIVRNTLNVGDKAVLIDGISSPGSNANILKNVFVKGKFRTFVHIKGNNNSWYGGDTEWHASESQIDDIWLIEGVGNLIVAPYMEAHGGMPAKLFRFTLTAFSNILRDVYAQFWTSNIGAATLDEGWGNEVAFKPVGYNFPFPSDNSGLTNLIPNSHFRTWKDSSPVGWGINSGTFYQDSKIVRGAAYSLRMVAASNNPLINCFIAGQVSSITGLPIERFRGQTVVAGVWVKTKEAGLGNIKIWTNGTGGGAFGNNMHTGDDTWQFLTAMAKIPTDATQLTVQLRGFNSGMAGSGEAYFSEPMLVEGVHLSLPTPIFLNDSYSKMNGVFIHNQPIDLKDGDITPSVKDGNIFKTSNKQKTNITDFKNGSAGQEITVIFVDGNTTVDFTGTRLRGNRSLPWLAFSGDHMTCVFDGTSWYCDVSVNSRRD